MVVSVEDVPARDVARPGSAEELAEVVRQADDRGLAVAPIGGGTQLDLGNPPARLDLLVETTGLNRVVEYEPADLTITVEAGIRFTDLQATLGQEGQMLAVELLGRGALEAAGLSRQTAVVVRVGGYPEAVQRQVRDLNALVQKHGGEPVDATDATWDALKRMQLAAQRKAVVLKVAVPIAELTVVVDLLEQQLKGFESAVWAHAGSGVAYAACDTAPEADTVLQLRRQVVALGSNASLVVQRCPTVLKRSVDVWGDPGPSLGLMKALKAKLDPRGTLNPGRY